MAEEIFLSVNQVSIILKVHPLTVRRYIKDGKLKAVRMAGNVRIPQSSIDLFTHEISPSEYGQKAPAKLDKDPIFELNDPIFRLKGRGMSLKPLEFNKD